MTSQYLVWACTLGLIGGACTSSVPPPSASQTTATSASAPASTASLAPGLPGPVAVARLALDRIWYTVPPSRLRLSAAEPATATVDFSGDVSSAAPRVRLDPGGRDFALLPTATPGRWTARVDLAGIAPGAYTVTAVERIAGSDVVMADTRWGLRLSEPEYVVWTLDFEGDAASDETMANTAEVADALRVPMTVMWNPRASTTTAVTPARADAMLAWTKGRAARDDEVALHLHMWTDYVRAAGVAPRLGPTWAGRADGYDVPMTAYTEEDQRTLIRYGLQLMSDQGLTGVTSFRAGGLFADAATLRAALAAGLTADCSGTPAGTFGSLRLPWTLPPDAQPYRPAKDDANRAGDLALLEAPTNGGNTYGYTSSSIASVARADLAMLARPGEIATAPKALTIVSHPGTIDAAERAAIETLLHAFDPLRYDQDRGPLRFVTLRQLAQAWR